MSDAPAKPHPVEVAYTELTPETLHNVVHDLVTRDGTDYGEVEKTTEQKAEALMRQLTRGEAKLVFDPETETIGLMTTVEWKRLQRLHESQQDTQEER